MSEWSDKFSLDTVGSVGTVECKLKDQMMQVGTDRLYFLIGYSNIPVLDIQQMIASVGA